MSSHLYRSTTCLSENGPDLCCMCPHKWRKTPLDFMLLSSFASRSAEEARLGTAVRTCFHAISSSWRLTFSHVDKSICGRFGNTASRPDPSLSGSTSNMPLPTPGPLQTPPTRRALRMRSLVLYADRCVSNAVCVRG
jgi:hypothetical protein